MIKLRFNNNGNTSFFLIRTIKYILFININNNVRNANKWQKLKYKIFDFLSLGVVNSYWILCVGN